MPIFLRALFNIIKLMTDKRVSFKRKLLFMVPVAYLLFPFDLIGDFFPIAGQLDDVAVFVVMWPILKNLLTDYKQGKYNENKNFDKKDEDKTIDINKDDYKFE